MDFMAKGEEFLLLIIGEADEVSRAVLVKHKVREQALAAGGKPKAEMIVHAGRILNTVVDFIRLYQNDITWEHIVVISADEEGNVTLLQHKELYAVVHMNGPLMGDLIGGLIVKANLKVTKIRIFEIKKRCFLVK